MFIFTGKPPKELSNSPKSSSSPSSSSPESEENVRMSRRLLRKKSATRGTSPETGPLTTPTSIPCPDNASIAGTPECNSQDKSNVIESEKIPQKSSVLADSSLPQKVPNELNSDQKKPEQLEKPSSCKSSIVESPSQVSDSTPKVQKYPSTRRSTSSMADAKASVNTNQNVDSSLELKQPCSESKSKCSSVDVRSDTKGKEEEECSLESEKSKTTSKLETSKNIKEAVSSETENDSPSSITEAKKEVTKPNADSKVTLSATSVVNSEPSDDEKKKELKVIEKLATRSKQEECVSRQSSVKEGDSSPRKSRKRSMETEPCNGLDRESLPQTTKDEEKGVDQESPTIDIEKPANATSLKVDLEKKSLSAQEMVDTEQVSSAASETSKEPAPEKGLLSKKDTNNEVLPEAKSNSVSNSNMKTKSSEETCVVDLAVEAEDSVPKKLDSTGVRKSEDPPPKSLVESSSATSDTVKSTTTRSSHKKSSSSECSPSLNRKAVGLREQRRSKENATDEEVGLREFRRKENAADEEVRLVSIFLSHNLCLVFTMVITSAHLTFSSTSPW